MTRVGRAALNRATPAGKRRAPADNAACLRPRLGEARGFTVVELMVVIGIIALILVIGVPAFNSMTVQQRLSKTRQLLNGALTRTHIVSISDRTLTAVRICPAGWQLDEEAASGSSGARQIITTYSYRATAAANPNRPSDVVYAERFERLENGPTQLLPPDTWIAPSEALLDRGAGDLFDGDFVLEGRIGQFTLDATDAGEDFLSADAFLIVFDPESGVVRQNSNWPWKRWPLLAYDPRTTGPTAQLETDGVRNNAGNLVVPFQRFNFAGAIVYRREPFAALGSSAESETEIEARRNVLRRFGQTYYVSRTGGSLVAGAGEGAGGD